MLTHEPDKQYDALRSAQAAFVAAASPAMLDAQTRITAILGSASLSAADAIEAAQTVDQLGNVVASGNLAAADLIAALSAGSSDKLDDIAPGLWWQIALDDEKAMGELEALRRQFDEARRRLDRRFEDKVDKLRRGDELPPGVMKMVKVFVAVKRKLQPGDQMAGRHGNKGSSPRSCRSRTCPTWKTVSTWTSC